MAIRSKNVCVLAFAILIMTATCKAQAQECGFIGSGIYGQCPPQPKLTIIHIDHSQPLPDGAFDWTLSLKLTRNRNNPPVSFDLKINDVKTLEDIYNAKLKLAVNQLTTDLNTAVEHFQPPPR